MNRDRRAFLKLAATGAVVAPFGCRSKTDPHEEGPKRELNIFVYAGGHETTIREVFVPRFEESTGATVSIFAGWWDGIAKLKVAGRKDPPFDLMITDATQGYPAAKEGLFATIDFRNIPNHTALAPAALDHWIFKEGYGLLYPDSVMTLAFDWQQVFQLPVSWKDLLKPEWSGKLGFYNHFYMSLYTFACIMADANGKAGTAHELIANKIDDVFRFAIDQRQRIKLWWPTSTEMILALNDRRVLAGNMHSPEYWQAMSSKRNLGAVVPKEDRAMVQVFWAIPAGTANQDLAERAIELMFSAEMQLEFCRRGMATARADTAKIMAEADLNWRNLYPHTPEQFRTLKYYPYDVYAGQWDQLVDRWERTVLRKA